MSVGVAEPVCALCSADSSPIWRRQDGKILCLDCHAAAAGKKEEKGSCEPVAAAAETPPPPANKKRKGGRGKGAKGGGERAPSASSTSHISQSSLQGRRTLLKGKPMKAPPSEPRLLTSDSVLHKGVAYEVGDVVSLLDYSGGIYYAIIQGFLVDQYASHYAVLRWALPKTPNPSCFDPSNFILGPDDDEPRKLELLDFVCHSPNSRSFSQSFSHNYESAIKWLT